MAGAEEPPKGRGRVGSTNFTQASLRNLGKAGVCSVRGDGSPILPKKYRKYFLRVRKDKLSISAKETSKPLKEIEVRGCIFSIQGLGANKHIRMISKHMSIRIKTSREKDLHSWMLALQSSSQKHDLRGHYTREKKADSDSPPALGLGLVKSSPFLREDTKRRSEQSGSPEVEPEDDEPKTPSYEVDFTLPHLRGRKTMAVSFMKTANEPLGLKICGGGGPDGDPQRQEIFCLATEPKSVAAKAGLKRGDIIMAVGDVELGGLLVAEAAKVLSSVNGHVVLVILRKAIRRLSSSKLASLPSHADNGVSPAKEGVAKDKRGSVTTEEEEGGFGFPDPAPKRDSVVAGADSEEEEFGFPRSNSVTSKPEVVEKETPPTSAPTASEAKADSASPSEAPVPETETEKENEDTISPLQSPISSPAASPSPSSPTASEGDGSSPPKSDRAEKLRRMRESRRIRKDHSMVELNNILKVIDDLPED